MFGSHTTMEKVVFIMIEITPPQKKRQCNPSSSKSLGINQCNQYRGDKPWGTMQKSDVNNQTLDTWDYHF